MDNQRTLPIGTENGVVDMVRHWSAEIPIDGFEWIEGQEALTADLRVRDVFLVKRPGGFRRVPFSEELYVELADLDVKPAAILSFANKYGALHLLDEHFHRLDNSEIATGERLYEWQFEARKFQDTLQLWQCAETGKQTDVRWIRSYCEPLWKPGKPWPLAYSPAFDSFREKPLELARRVVVQTINKQLAPHLRRRHKCQFPDCGFAPVLPDDSSQTRGSLRMAADGQIQLAIVSSDLLTTAWLQLAGYVAAQRKIKKCEAPDCGLYMDVTNSPRPGAKRMHQRCEERIRKQRYRENKRKGQK